MTDRLNAATLHSVPQGVAAPRYPRDAVRPGVVHLGIGAFHRAHQAIAFDDCLAAGDRRWGIVGVSLRSASVRDSLNPQDALYTVEIGDGAQDALRVVGAVQTVLVAPEDPAAVVAALAGVDTHIVTLTITEKGYKLDPATGALLVGDADVAHDLDDLSEPRTAAGFLVAGLARRRASGLSGLTAISCDNLPENGKRLRTAVLTMARAHDTALADWIEAQCTFPQTMVDRIVPATDAADLARIAGKLGLIDRAAVKTEPFLQWVIEDRFAGPRPDFVTDGITLTRDVRPWEEAKLRLLNGAHSGIAYLGGLAGIDFVHEFVGRDEGRHFVEALWDETASTLDPPTELDVAAYRTALLARFRNPALHHRTRQIAMDGSQKLPQRLLAPIADRIAAGLSCDALALAVAGWMQWVRGTDDSGARHAVDDPQAGAIAAALSPARDAEEVVAALLNLPGLAPAELARNAALRALLPRHLAHLESNGALATLRAL